MENQESKIPAAEAPFIEVFKFRRVNKYTAEYRLVYDFFNQWPTLIGYKHIVLTIL